MAAVPQRDTRCCTHPCWKVEFAATLASLGSLPVTGWPVALKMPLPASGNHWESAPVWGPYLAIEKLASFPRLGPSFPTQPMVGMVSRGWAPPDLAWEMKASVASPALGLL